MASATGADVLCPQLTQAGSALAASASAGHLSSLWMSLSESHRFFSLLLFLLHLFLVLLGWLFPPGKVRCIISFAKKEEII